MIIKFIRNNVIVYKCGIWITRRMSSFSSRLPSNHVLPRIKTSNDSAHSGVSRVQLKCDGTR
jgi:hypothetical protein